MEAGSSAGGWATGRGGAFAAGACAWKISGEATAIGDANAQTAAPSATVVSFNDLVERYLIFFWTVSCQGNHIKVQQVDRGRNDISQSGAHKLPEMDTRTFRYWSPRRVRPHAAYEGQELLTNGRQHCTWANTQVIGRSQVEGLILTTLKDHLMAPEAITAFSEKVNRRWRLQPESRGCGAQAGRDPGASTAWSRRWPAASAVSACDRQARRT
jgi:hypothetical protein